MTGRHPPQSDPLIGGHFPVSGRLALQLAIWTRNSLFDRRDVDLLCFGV